MAAEGGGLIIGSTQDPVDAIDAIDANDAIDVIGLLASTPSLLSRTTG